jgi:16S rRNA (uracil1498-N3)-methyltransferase
MKQLILSGAEDAPGAFILRGKDYHYIVRVLRLKKGWTFPAQCEDGRALILRVEEISGSQARCVIEEERGAAFSDKRLPAIMLAQGLPKGTKMDLVARQAAECGVAEILPFIAERSVKRPREAVSLVLQERWRRIVREARQQSGSTAATAVRAPMEKGALFERWEELKGSGAARGIVFCPEAPREAALHSYLAEKCAFLVLVIGPEGGFSASETGEFIARGFKALSLGSTILRAETAALYAVAAARILLLEKESWKAIAKE